MNTAGIAHAPRYCFRPKHQLDWAAVSALRLWEIGADIAEFLRPLDEPPLPSRLLFVRSRLIAKPIDCLSRQLGCFGAASARPGLAGRLLAWVFGEDVKRRLDQATDGFGARRQIVLLSSPPINGAQEFVRYPHLEGAVLNSSRWPAHLCIDLYFLYKCSYLYSKPGVSATPARL